MNVKPLAVPWAIFNLAAQGNGAEELDGPPAINYMTTQIWEYRRFCFRRLGEYVDVESKTDSYKEKWDTRQHKMRAYFGKLVRF